MSDAVDLEKVLLPCPFCGGAPHIERRGTARASMIIECGDCGCRVESGDVVGMTKAEDYRWNRRWITPAAPPRDEP